MILGGFFIVAGANHFLHTQFYLNIMPPYLPIPLALVYLSGIFEVVGGVGVLIPQFRSMAGWGLIVLLIAVFPANLHMAFNTELFPTIKPIILWTRLPVQVLLLLWVHRTTHPKSQRRS